MGGSCWRYVALGGPLTTNGSHNMVRGWTSVQPHTEDVPATKAVIARSSYGHAYANYNYILLHGRVYREFST